MNPADLTNVPKYERITIDEKTSIEVPLERIDETTLQPGDQVQFLVGPRNNVIHEAVILRKKKLKQ